MSLDDLYKLGNCFQRYSTPMVCGGMTQEGGSAGGKLPKTSSSSMEPYVSFTYMYSTISGSQCKVPG